MEDNLEAILLQSQIVEWFSDKYGNERWTTIYQSGSLAKTGVSLFACLIPVERCAKSLAEPSWDLRIGSGGPGFITEWRSGESVTYYRRMGEDEGIEPIALVRHFHHGRPDYVEISEDLRLLFNLYEDRSRGLFYEVEEDGNEVEVIRILTGKTEIRTALLRRYIAARQLALVLQIESDVWAKLDKGAPLPKLPEEQRVSTNQLCYHFYSDIIHHNQVFSRLLGKKVVLPPDRSECGIPPFDAPKEYIDFIVGEDERGRPVEHTCDPDVLSNYFGANPGAPHYLTPVFFKREVLRKYYENSDRYEVQDGRVGSHGMWHLQLDNNHPDHVVVFLGDLGRDIPTSEQRYWRSHNIKPEERGLSETAVRRSFLGEFADAESAEHSFKWAYDAINEPWTAAYGWPLFKELHPDDRHVLSSLRLPLANTADEFDSQMLDLAKLLVDSLNEEAIVTALATPPKKDDKGIAKLEQLLRQWGYSHTERDMALLRTIQGVRSRGVAHRKGSDYDLAQAGLDPDDYHQSFQLLFERCTQMLSDLEAHAKEQVAERTKGE
jgi:plasmid stabilization system protein ParE